ncbi:hypothetical protein AVEN_116750-1 [Araneus ventricosus]|uniref:Uncharacterized protein n=1 Tax=Araneus ventricosus TaxID=182803 RepID=A0A4Y2Q970_ARAVE|nr:hypothetical protein AVEN_116750-1 [Araneus ventricosus]
MKDLAPCSMCKEQDCLEHLAIKISKTSLDRISSVSRVYKRAVVCSLLNHRHFSSDAAIPVSPLPLNKQQFSVLRDVLAFNFKIFPLLHVLSCKALRPTDPPEWTSCEDFRFIPTQMESIPARRGGFPQNKRPVPQTLSPAAQHGHAHGILLGRRTNISCQGLYIWTADRAERQGERLPNHRGARLVLPLRPGADRVEIQVRRLCKGPTLPHGRRVCARQVRLAAENDLCRGGWNYVLHCHRAKDAADSVARGTLYGEKVYRLPTIERVAQKQQRDDDDDCVGVYLSDKK